MSAIRPVYAPDAMTRVNSYLGVLHALMLRDMRTRFGGSHWGFCITVLWPVVHVLFITFFMTYKGIASPMSTGTFVFIASGAVPVLTYQYLSRMVMLSVVLNKPLTYYPQVKVFDLVLARTLVEIITGFSGLAVVLMVATVFGVDPVPTNPSLAIQGYLAAIFFGIGMGWFNIGIVHFFPAWQIGYMLFIILMYMSSGVYFMPNFMPEQVYSIMRWNPMVQIVEWVRLGYDPSLPLVVDKLYIFLFAGIAMTIGLLLERNFVRKG